MNFSVGKSTRNYACIAVVCLTGIFWKFLFLNHYLFFKDIGNDSYYQIYPYIKAVNALNLNDKFLSWSFCFGTGQLVSGIYTGNVLNWPLFFIKSEYIPKGIILMEIIKFFLTGFFYFKYLERKSFSPVLSVLGGCLVMMSSFMIINASWFNYYSYTGLLWVLWLFSLEKFAAGQLRWLILCVFLTAIDQVYNVYLFGLFSLMYLFIKNFGIKNRKQIMIKLGTVFIGGLLPGAILIASNIYSIINSPRFDPKYSYFDQLYKTPVFQFASFSELKTFFLRLFSNNIEGIGYGYEGWNIYVEAPLLFIGSISVLLIGHHFIKKQSRIDYKHLIGFLIILTIVLFPFFRYAIWFFSADYFRVLSFVVGLLVFESGLKILNDLILEKREINFRILTLSLLVILLFFILFRGNYNFYYFKSIALLICFFTLIAFVKNKQIMLYLIVGLSLSDSLSEAYSSINTRPVVKAEDFEAKKGFNDFSQDAVNWIKAYDKGFYRTEKDFSSGDASISSLNDAIVQGYNSTKVFTSFNHISYVKYLKGMQDLKFETEHDTRWIAGGMDRFEMLDNLGVKYILSKGIFDWTQVGYVPLKKTGDVVVFKNPHAVPMGTLFNKIIKETDYERLALERKRSVMRDFLVVPDSSVPAIMETFSTVPAVDSMAAGDTHLNIDFHDHNRFTGKIQVKDPAILYFSIPYDEGWKVRVDGRDTEKFRVNYGMSAVLMPPGTHHVVLSYELPYLKGWLTLTILGIVLLFFIPKTTPLFFREGIERG